MKKLLIIFVLLNLVGLGWLFPKEKANQEKTPKLHHQITVTATRIKTPSRETGASIIILTKEELLQTGEPLLIKALQKTAVVSIIQSGPPGTATSLFLRGSNSEHTLVMIDGVEVNDPISPARSFDLAHLLTQNIERVEILPGPQSTLYGSDALGGVINIITSPGEGSPHLDLSAQIGSWKTNQIHLASAGQWRRLAFSFSLTHFQDEGISAASTAYPGNKEKDGYANLSLSSRLDFTFSPTNKLTLFCRAMKTRTEIDNFGGPYGDDPNNLQKNHHLIARLQWQHFLLASRWEQLLAVNLVVNQRKNNNPSDDLHLDYSEQAYFKSWFLKLDWQHNLYFHPQNTLTFGLDYKKELGLSDYTALSPWGKTISIFPQQQARSWGFYLQDFLRLPPYFFCQVGFRWDHYLHFGSVLTYRLTPTVFWPATQTQLKLNLGSAFKAPSLYQLYAPPSFFGPIGNENLQPEKSRAWEIGLHQYLFKDKTHVGLTFFSQDYENLIQFDFLRGFINTGRARSQGWSIAIKTHLFHHLQLNCNYTHLRARDRQTNQPLLRRPAARLNLGVSYNLKEKLTASLWLNYYGSRWDTDYAHWPPRRVALSAFKLINLHFGYNFWSSCQIFLRLDNLLNEQYELIKGYGTYGFSIYLGIKSKISL
ncbi:MAG: TonB-dependent receptor [Candidatus Aminicenantes bacterium]|nr:MAG: TonB-dependent receptor [Candidatus Aminicenantes bacterium]